METSASLLGQKYGNFTKSPEVEIFRKITGNGRPLKMYSQEEQLKVFVKNIVL